MTDNLYLLVITAMVGAALLVVSFILIVIYNSNKLLQQKRKLQEAELNYQKDLLYAVIDSQEKERQRIGMDLHDEVGSTLSSLRMTMEGFIEKVKDTPGADQFCTQSKKIIDDVITNVRTISHDLSPLGKGTYDFTDALKDLQDRVNLSGKIHMAADIQSPALNRLNTIHSLALYRVFTELINNTIKHAQATRIDLSALETEKNFNFNYTDNGIGIQKNTANRAPGIGMRNIESRLRMIGSDFTFKEAGTGGFGISIVLKK